MTTHNNLTQKFKYFDEIESQEVHYDKDGDYHCSYLEDIQESFPGAKHLKVNGSIILPLRDESGKRHDPPRIAHYPNDIIEIFTYPRSPEPSITTGSVVGEDGLFYSHRHVMGPSAEIVSVLSQSASGRTTLLNSTLETRAASNTTAEIQPVWAQCPDLLLPSLKFTSGTEATENSDLPCPARTPLPNPQPRHGSDTHVASLRRTPSPQQGPKSESATSPPTSQPLTLPADNSSEGSRIRSPSPRPPRLQYIPQPHSTSPATTSSKFPSSPSKSKQSPSSSISSHTSELSTTNVATDLSPPPQLPLASVPLPQSHHQFHAPMTPMSPHFSARFSHASSDASSLATEIAEINARINRASDRKSAHFYDLMKYFGNLIVQQKIMIEQNHQHQYRQHKHTHNLQHQQMSKLEVMDRKLDAILVQNYELHEYTIPRFFVILPENFERWDPRSFIMGKFRLYFLCECASHSTDYLSGPSSSTASTSPHRRVHLHNHKGYGFSRPKEFLERFGPYVLGMLKILSFCLRATTIAAPATGLINESVQDMMQGIESISKNTMENIISGSMALLKQNLDDNNITQPSSDNNPNVSEQDGDEQFQNVVALEGADLRRLTTFLRHNDEDKTLGNLYRTTTNEGHVKWVCLRHYRQSYRDATMLSFLRMLRENNGEYDPFLRKVTVTLTSSASSKAFFETLANQAPAVDELDVVLDWNFWTSDLELLVRSVYQSSVRSVKLDLKDPANDVMSKFSLRITPGSKYQPLLDLLSNKRLQGLSLSGVGGFGLRTSDFMVSQNFVSLRSFHFLHVCKTPEQLRLMKILTYCPNLADLRLGDYVYWSKVRQELVAVIAAMTHLKTLHLYGVRSESGGSVSGILSSFAARGSLKELVCYVGRVNERELSETIRNLSRTLEVLIVEQVQTPFLDLVPTSGSTANALPMPIPGLPSSPLSSSLPLSLSSMPPPFSRLTHLDLHAQLTRPSIDFLAGTLMHLNLVHLGLTVMTKDLLRHVNFSTLRSLCLFKFEEDDLSPLFDFISNRSDQCQLEALSLLMCIFTNPWTLARSLGTLALKRLQLSYLARTELKSILDALNLSRLEALILVRCQYDWTTEEILAAKREEFTTNLTLHLCIADEHQVEGIHKTDSRGSQDTRVKLACRRVRFYTHSQILLIGKPLLGVI